MNRSFRSVWLVACAAVAMATAANCSSSPSGGGGGGDTPDAGAKPDAGKPDAGRPDAGPSFSPPGSACTEDAQCGPSGACLQYLPGGYCVVIGCDLDANDCPAGSTCVQSSETETFCAAGPCQVDAECRQSEGYTCDYDGTCWSYKYVPLNEGGEPMGTACTNPDQCESGDCLPESDEAGGFTGFPGGYCTAYCSPDRPESCPATALCRVDFNTGEALCLKKCQNAGDCRTPDYSCIDGACEPTPVDPDTVPIGDACSGNGACGRGSCIEDPAFPGGYCTVEAECDLESGDGCGAHATCLALFLDELYPFCAKKCATDADCRTSERYRCDPDAKVCLRPAADPAAVPLGAACTSDEGCGVNGVCMMGEGFPGGYCVAPGCAPAEGGEPDTCEAGGGACFSLGAAPFSYCIKSCGQTSECRQGEGYVCDVDDTCWMP